jgi:hypothetical protein
MNVCVYIRGCRHPIDTSAPQAPMHTRAQADITQSPRAPPHRAAPTHRHLHDVVLIPLPPRVQELVRPHAHGRPGSLRWEPPLRPPRRWLLQAVEAILSTCRSTGFRVVQLVSPLVPLLEARVVRFDLQQGAKQGPGIARARSMGRDFSGLRAKDQGRAALPRGPGEIASSFAAPERAPGHSNLGPEAFNSTATVTAGY